MHIITQLRELAAAQLRSEYQLDVDPSSVLVNITKREFEGDYTVVLFPYVKQLKISPEQIGNRIGELLKQADSRIAGFNVVKGFLNISLSPDFWSKILLEEPAEFWKRDILPKGEKVMVEFSSPNTNKPLHLGHVRNILLGWSVSQIYEALGYEVVKTQIINDRGIAICKSMLAWEKFGEGETPESTGIKGDHFVGDWYVRFEQEFQKEYKAWQTSEQAELEYEARKDKEHSREAFFKQFKNQYFNAYSQLGSEARAMLLKWEAGDQEVVELWERMNGWVYAGFDETYLQLGVDFDKLYYESDTYLLGKTYVEQGLTEGSFYKKEDGSVWVDLTDEGLDEKILLRSDGTSVYITQDIGTAQKRFEDFGFDRMVYVVADEQNYHFQVLFASLKKLGAPYAGGLYHLAYGMVDLPTGKMKSREGTVVDADDLMAEVIGEATEAAADRGEITDLSKEEQYAIIKAIAMGALKYFILKVDARKRMTFDPKESLDLQGQTGPYIQNAYVRIRSILRKAGDINVKASGAYKLSDQERQLLTAVIDFGFVMEQAAQQYDPSGIAHYLYDLAKDFHRYYHEVRILKAETDAARAFRLQLIREIAKLLHEGMRLLGINMPERM